MTLDKEIATFMGALLVILQKFYMGYFKLSCLRFIYGLISWLLDKNFRIFWLEPRSVPISKPCLRFMMSKLHWISSGSMMKLTEICNIPLRTPFCFNILQNTIRDYTVDKIRTLWTTLFSAFTPKDQDKKSGRFRYSRDFTG